MRHPRGNGRPANRTYYFDVGRGVWRGSFGFRITSWRGLLRDGVGFRNRLLAVGMALLVRLLGRCPIVCRVEGDPSAGEAGIATNDMRITKLGATLHHLREEYRLHADGKGVTVRAKERFGPFPFLPMASKEYTAEILDGGMRAVYRIALLGTEWVGRYEVAADRDHITSRLACPWAEATQSIARAS